MKKIKNIIISSLIFVCIKTYSQNLIPNPSFENYYDCTNDNYQISNAVYWKGMMSPDYFNSCIIPVGAAYTDVPNNVLGSQNPFTGNAYAGLITYVNGNGREFIYVKFSSALILNTTYCVSYNVSLADSAMYAGNKIGAYITVDTIIPPYVTNTSPPFYTFTYYTPQIESDSLLSDTSSWTSINGLFVSQGNEQYITIGNFRDNSATDTVRVHNNNSYPFAYYYIDNVSVEAVLNANAGNDTSLYFGDSIQIGNNITENASYLWTPAAGLSDPTTANPMASPTITTTYIVTKTQCSVTTKDTVSVSYLGVGIDEKNRSQKIKIFPNPSNGNFTLECNLQSNESGWIRIFDLTGSLVKQYQITNSTKTDLNLQSLQAGMYQYEVIINGEPVKNDKLIMIK